MRFKTGLAQQVRGFKFRLQSFSKNFYYNILKIQEIYFIIIKKEWKNEKIIN